MNWVELRYICNAQQMFLCLADRIERDIEAWRKLPEKPIQAYVAIAAREPTAIYITWKSHKPGRYEKDGSHVVEALGNEIDYRHISQGNHQIRSEAFIPTLNKDGNCVFTVNEKEYELWEVSRRILEPLLF